VIQGIGGTGAARGRNWQFLFAAGPGREGEKSAGQEPGGGVLDLEKRVFKRCWNKKRN
jgi:hypothetical protein